MKNKYLDFDDILKRSEGSLIPTAKVMEVEHEYMLAMCEDEGHHRQALVGGSGFTTCYCGDSMVLFVNT